MRDLISWRRSRRTRSFETLEPRLVLDSTVVFNEIMYNPPGEDETLEWIELHSQMAVDMDLSEWTIEGGAQFEFPDGTIAPGGGYLIVAKEPVAFAAATGIADALGPYDGQLANGGERLELRNVSDRLMDSVRYADDGLWPVGPDGSGATLAKRDRDLGSEPAASWAASAEIGGTPGRENFPRFDPARQSAELISLYDTWQYRTDDTPPPDGWNAPWFDDADWASGQALFGAGPAAIDFAGGPLPEPPSAGGVTIRNAGFEEPQTGFGNGSAFLYRFFSDIPEWNASAGVPTGIGSTQNDSVVVLTGLVPPEGDQAAVIWGAGQFRQTIEGLTVGQTYVVSYFENQGFFGAWNGTSSPIAGVTFDGAEIVASHTATRTTTWRRVQSVPFIATATSGVLRFENFQDVGDNVLLMDDVRIMKAGPAVDGGDFENPDVSADGFQINPPDSGWMHVASGVAHNGGAFTEGDTSAPEGNQIGFLSGSSSIEQQLTGVIPGASYVLSWFEQARQFGDSPYGNDLAVSLVDAQGHERVLYSDLVRNDTWQE